MKQLEIVRDLKQEDFQKSELDWLKIHLPSEFKKGIPESRVIFTTNRKKHLTYIRVSEKLMNGVSSRFMKAK
ncbi:MAG: hypothetical protein P1Q69_17665 [Candidatus Thorarchaeota archaeon]|nr:hypothetical protein [Candidatus Thorarchaeota archaeon]